MHFWRDFGGTWLLAALVRGMVLTGTRLVSPQSHDSVPGERTPLSPRFRALHALRRYANGEERVRIAGGVYFNQTGVYT